MRLSRGTSGAHGDPAAVRTLSATADASPIPPPQTTIHPLSVQRRSELTAELEANWINHQRAHTRRALVLEGAVNMHTDLDIDRDRHLRPASQNKSNPTPERPSRASAATRRDARSTASATSSSAALKGRRIVGGQVIPIYL